MSPFSLAEVLVIYVAGFVSTSPLTGILQPLVSVSILVELPPSKFEQSSPLFSGVGFVQVLEYVLVLD